MSLLLRRSSTSTTTEPSPWVDAGLLDNPFRPAGFGVDYDVHMQREVSRLDTWLDEVVDGSRPRPLAIKGSIGIGKTHLLRRVETVLVRHAKESKSSHIAAAYFTVTAGGARNLQLGTLLLDAMRSPLSWRDRGDAETASAEAEMPIVEEVLAALKRGVRIPESLPIGGTFRHALSRAGTDAGRRAFGNWLSQRELSQKEQEMLGVSGRLRGEGEAVRVFADLARVARAISKFKVWVLLIDQIEDLWRRHEVTPVKRARFLTDLRALVDEGLAGAPVALLMAWNTEVERAAVEGMMKQDYAALWSRLGEPIDLPRLAGEHAVPFAFEYISAEHARFQARHSGDSRNPAALQTALQTAAVELMDATRKRENVGASTGLVPRLWLETLREWADKWVAERPPPPRVRRFR